MQIALFIRQNPPWPAVVPASVPSVPTTLPSLPFADELQAAARQRADEETPKPRPPSSSSPKTTFTSLPAEIRSAIWTESLPRRVIGLRPHPVADDAAPSPSAIHSTSVVFGERVLPRVQPAVRHSSGSRMPPPMASVCYEARAVATRSGRWTMGAEGQPVWFDPTRDTILLNSRRPADYVLPAKQTVLTDAAPRARDAATTVTMADLGQHPLVGCLDEAVRSGGGIAVDHEILRSHVGSVVFPLLQACAAIGKRDDLVGAQLLVYFDEIAVTGTHAQAVASGLFGGAAAPEEQMLFVPLSDRETLLRIHAASRVRPGRQADTRVVATSGVGRSWGGLRVGHAGLIRELLRPSHALQNLRLLAICYLDHLNRWHGHLDSEPSDLLIARALEEGMPPLEQAVLFRFKEVPEGEEHRSDMS